VAENKVDSERARTLDIVLRRTVGPPEVERALSVISSADVGAASWFEGLRQGKVRFDLAQVEFADFAALGHLVLLVEGLIRHEVAVEVRLPAPFSGALRFIRRAGFEDAVRCRHVPDADQLISVIEADGSTSDRRESVARGDELASDAVGEAGPVGETSLPLRVLPLQWVPRWSSGEQRTTWEHEAAEVLDLRSLVLTAGEARAFSELLVRELVENVHAHAPEPRGASVPPAALVGAVFIEKPAARALEIGARDVARGHLAEIVASQTSILRLVVGDSGIGLEATMGKRFARQLVVARRGHARGLASVRRLVRENHGSLLFRSGEELGGVLYPNGGTRQNVAEASLAWSPGTFVDVTLALRVLVRAPAGPDHLTSSAPAIPPVGGLVPLGMTDDQQSIDIATAARDIRDRLASEPRGFLVASLPIVEMSDRTAERLFDQVLVLAEELPKDGCLVVLAPASSASRLFPQARAYDDSRARGGARLSAPVMLRDERGRTAWLGAGSVKGRLLAHLTAEAGRRSPLGSVTAALGMTVASVREAADDLGGWLEHDAGEVWLRVTPPVVDAALPDLLRAQLDAALALPAVAQHGAFLTPTLERVSMWLNGTRLIQEMGGSHLLGYTLATLVREQHPDLDLKDALLIRLGTHLPDAFARAFGDTLGLKRKIYRLSGEVGFYDDPESLFVGQSTPVVLLTDVIVSGNTARGAAVDLLRQGADPRLLVALIDYGRVESSERNLAPATVVLSLARVDNPEPAAERALTMIEPLRSRRGLGYASPVATYRLGREDLLQWCSKCRESILTGHIARLARRHFSTFLNARALLRTGSETAAAISGAVADEVRAYLAELQSSPRTISRVELWFPGEVADVAGSLARLVSDHLDDGDLPPTRCASVERVLRGGRWVFPALTEPLAAGTHVVVVDWGAVTTHTIHDLLGRAADGNAAAVHAVVFTSQVAAEDEAAVRRVRWIGRDDGGELPTRVSFVSSFQIGYEAAAECRLCAVVREYSHDAQTAPAAVLRAHAQQLATLLEPSDLTDAQARGPRDLFGEDLTPGEAVDIVRWRHDLGATLAGTEQRSMLLDRLRSLSLDDLGDLVSLVRLLLLEPRWLKLSPLRLTGVRAVLADLVVELIRGERFDHLPVTVQRQLVIVLRMAAKRAFLRVIPDMVDPTRRVALPSVVTTDALFGVYTIIKRPYHHHRPHMASSRDVLLDAIHRIDGSDASRGDERSLGALTVLNALLALVDYHESNPFVAGPGDARQAWATLRHRYYKAAVGHFDVAVRMSNIITALQVTSVRESDKWLSTFNDWQHIQRFLTERVLPYLPKIQQIVTSYVDEFGSHEDIEGWMKTLTSDIVRELNGVAELLNRFVADPQRALLERAAAWQKIEWWYKFFFLRGPRLGDFPIPSLLRLLHDCPCDVAASVTQGVQNGEDTARRLGREFDAVNVTFPDRPLQAFVTRSVLENTIHQLVENAAKHHDPAVESSELEIEIADLGSEIAVTVRNSGSRATEVAGSGLYRFKQYLGAFDASLEQVVAPTARWTFEMRLTLLKWTGVDSDENRGAS
jgi:hypothetical protein